MTTELQAAAAELVTSSQGRREMPRLNEDIDEALRIVLIEMHPYVVAYGPTVAEGIRRRLQKLGFSIVRTSTLRNSRNGVYDTRTDKDVD